jgi:hypothetical protein
MSKKKPGSSKQTNVRTGNISDITGTVNVAGGNITTHHIVAGLSAAEIRQVFDGLYATIEANAKASETEKEDLKSEVKQIESAVTEAAKKNEKVDEGFLASRFRNIARMAPDILDVVSAALGGPLAVMGVAAKKIAQKAKEETGTA